MGRRPLKKRAMTNAEYQKRWRQKQRIKRMKDPSARRRTPARHDSKDLWPTPVDLQIALVRYMLPFLPDGPVWENAAGFGDLSDAMRAAGRVVIESDIEPRRTGMLCLDFLTGDPPAETKGAVLVTNPPFNLMDAFCERALALLDAGWLKSVTFLFRADKANSQNRVALLNRAAYELTVTARTMWINDTEGKNPRWWFYWITWVAGKNGPPVHRRINRDDLD
jgi:hypothetical protein